MRTLSRANLFLSSSAIFNLESSTIGRVKVDKKSIYVYHLLPTERIKIQEIYNA